MRIHKNIEILSLYIDGRLKKDIKDIVDVHIKECSECREILLRFQETRKLLSGAEIINPPEYLEKEILQNLPSTRSFTRCVTVPVLGTLTMVILGFLVIQKNIHRDDVHLVYQSPPEMLSNDVVKQKGESAGKEEVSNITEEMVKPAPVIEEKPVLARSQMDKENSIEETGGINGDTVKEIETEDKNSAYEGKKVRVLSSVVTQATKEKKMEEATPSKKGDIMPTFMVIRDRNEWQNIWEMQNRAQNLSTPVPDVDFDTKMVVVLPSRIEDRAYKVVNTVEEKDKVIIQYKEVPLKESPQEPYNLKVVNQSNIIEIQNIEETSK
ncbi:MAG TPA: hypothetical protein PLQ41_05300 [bacterium]|nr:hypothetical protein [bacterium]HPP30336.1 hypothetical protein [bacterium]